MKKYIGILGIVTILFFGGFIARRGFGRFIPKRCMPKQFGCYIQKR